MCSCVYLCGWLCSCVSGYVAVFLWSRFKAIVDDCVVVYLCSCVYMCLVVKLPTCVSVFLGV